ncbi:restriction endonuclease [Celeribacter sp. ULVN23_4]
MEDRSRREEARSRYLAFEELVADIFRANNFEVERNLLVKTGSSQIEVDLLVTWSGNVNTVVEVKLYRGRYRHLPNAKQAIAQVLNAQAACKADHAMIVTNLYRENISSTLELDADVTLLGIEDLLALAPDPELRERISQMDDELSSALGDFDASGISARRAKNTTITLSLAKKSQGGGPKSVPQASTRGADLKRELFEIETGKTHMQTLASGRKGVNWRLFEDVCYEALQYVFDGVLGNWDKQKPVAGDDSRFDAISKIQGGDVFCRTLIEHFGSRHILFEFKNYKDPVGANLIHITEKYLYPKALRGVAVIISPQGFDEPARRASHGALRDTGKLVLDLSRNQLGRLLDEKDNAQPPGEIMETLLDTHLLAIGR